MEDWLLQPNHYLRLWNGTQATLQLLGQAFVLGVALSLLVGVARLSKQRWIRGAALVYVEFARGISSVILLFIMVIALPILFGIRGASVMFWGSIALGINMGGYGAEIVRGAIQAIPRGQNEASIALNLSGTQRLRHVVLPQAMRIILPPMGNLTIEILKGTALVSVVGGIDLMRETQNLVSTQLAAGVAGVTTLFVNVLLIYFVIAQVINGLFRLAERALARRYEQRTGRRAVPVPEVAA
ncbi:amino acid ABC transporter permease [Egicoccus sp. AB-alg2]|uniref:amino acid ABC transporter permease n=1 Tax=Egicoccus sp. AB-alg2 TaxID=3242693 RepID=UPI00359D2C7D